jgi:hypothetical protein
MPAVLWEELCKQPPLLPLPTPSPNDQQTTKKSDGAVNYLEYDRVKYEKTINIHRPSYKPPTVASTVTKSLDKEVSNETKPAHLSSNATLFHKSYARHFVVCQGCGKRRVVYAWPIIGMNVAARVNELKSYLSEPLFEYLCGDRLFGRVDDPEPHPPEVAVFHVRQALTCAIPMESHYFSADKFLPVCAHCGNDDDHVPVQEVALTTEGRNAYSICRDCYKTGKKPLLHGQKSKVGNSSDNRKRGTNFVSKSTKKVTVNQNMDHDPNKKRTASIFDQKKKANNQKEKRISEPIPAWTKDTQIPIKEMQLECKFQETLEPKFNFVDVAGDGHCGYHVLQLFLEKTGRQKCIALNEFRLGLVEFALENIEQLMGHGRFFGSNTNYRRDRLDFQLDRIHPRGIKVFDKPCDSSHWMYVDWAIPLAQWKYHFNAVLFTDEDALNGVTTNNFGWSGDNASMNTVPGTIVPDTVVDDTLYFLHVSGNHYVYLDPK